MSDILKELSDMRRADAEGRERTIPMSEMMRRAEAAPPPRDFAAVFRRDGVNVIAELKRASPSEGMMLTLLSLLATTSRKKVASSLSSTKSMV